MNYRRLVIVGLGLLLSVLTRVAAAQLAGSIRGSITDKDFNDAPLAGVKVTVVETEQSAISDAQGGYEIQDVPPGTYNLVFTRDGFVRQLQTEVLVNEGQLTEIGMSMPSEFTELDPFVVQQIKLDTGTELGLLELRTETPAFLDSVGEAQLSAAGVSDASGALSLISGATVSDNKAVIRGLPNRYVNSQVNSVRFPSADRETRALELDQFPTDVIDSIQVSKTFTPDQQGDASGGAVNILLKGIPDQDVVKLGVGTGYNTNLTGNDDFRSYDDGGLDFLGIDQGRLVQPSQPAPNPLLSPIPTPIGTKPGDAPFDYSADVTIAKRYEFPESGWTIGGVVNLFYGHGGSFYDDGYDAEYFSYSLVLQPFSNPGVRTRIFAPDVGGAGVSTADENDLRDSNVFDITKSTEEVQWGGLATFGLENENNKIDFVYLETNSIEDTTTVETDTSTRTIMQKQISDRTDIIRSGAFAFFDEFTVGTPVPISDTGSDAAFTRNQTIARQERRIQSTQLIGRHTLAFFEEKSLNDDGTLRIKSPEIDWVAANSSSKRREPDKRFFNEFLDGSGLLITDPARVMRGSAIPGGSGQGGVPTPYALRVWESIEERSHQGQINFKLPFVLPNNEEGYLRAGLFRDRVEREYARDSYGTGISPGNIFAAVPVGVDFFDFFLSDNLTDSQRTVEEAIGSDDVSYDGTYDIDAHYIMLDLPVLPRLRVVGGVRVETTQISLGLSDIDEFATGIQVNPSGSFQGTTLWANYTDGNLDNAFDGNLANGERATSALTGGPLGDVDSSREDILPSLTLIYEATDQLSFRGAYSQTIARPTFRELSPVRDVESLGSTAFYGNSGIDFSEVTNYDFRVDYRPTPGGLISFSLFYKEILNPIEEVAVTQDPIITGTYILAANLPEGEILGAELELRQDLGEYVPELTGLSLGANGTFIESEVQIGDTDPDFVAITGEDTRRMLNAPEMLLNFFAVYRNEETGTDMGLFYTVRGETLVAGGSAIPGSSGTNQIFVPNIFETQYDTLNFTVAQKLGEHFKLKFSAKNLTNPEIQRVYRSSLTPETLQSSYTKGIDLSLSLSATFEF